MKKWLLRIIILLFIVTLFSYTNKNPIFKSFEENIRENEGNEYNLYFVEIVGELSPNRYLIGTGFNRKYLIVETQGEFENGQIVSFRGRINNGKLVAVEHHLHGYPLMPYYLSILGLALFSFIFFREWRVSIKNLSIRRR